MHWAEDGWHNGCFIKYFINIWGVPYNILSIFRGIQYIILSIFFKSSSWWQTQGYLLFVWKQTNICGVKIAIVCCRGLICLVAGFGIIKELTCGITCRKWECMVRWPRMRGEEVICIGKWQTGWHTGVQPLVYLLLIMALFNIAQILHTCKT